MAVENVVKAWIPEKTWWDIEKQYDWAYKQIFNNKKVTNAVFNRALRLSRIAKPSDSSIKFTKGAKQLLIPTFLINDSNLDFKVDCRMDWKRLPDNTVVDYRGWTKNVIGIPQ
ncbi:hypothetical protein CGCSCA5_v015090 [Colletotrichum siamense]|uniref:uncharacterized protein n=1 Tax=Colletotrichum siamense TaxID=690259 RepID=UPI00187264D2|nr:uncharacterized protein CGCS363_v015148 [Colletotrichum siamense]KAF4805735.1 hypothetical protein CGCSCA5_v015090 [Colletotrichum siamense]KAF4859679.1 hypothetical protein CGCSCA1_v015114 [Colletotrichum siamense]KAF5482823.1 hypothetical protein CGCS363_v015148 [Colletotrichum siamense]